jgi:hypothetical protein
VEARPALADPLNELKGAKQDEQQSRSDVRDCEQRMLREADVRRVIERSPSGREQRLQKDRTPSDAYDSDEDQNDDASPQPIQSLPLEGH